MTMISRPDDCSYLRSPPRGQLTADQSMPSIMHERVNARERADWQANRGGIWPPRTKPIGRTRITLANKVEYSKKNSS